MFGDLVASSSSSIYHLDSDTTDTETSYSSDSDTESTTSCDSSPLTEPRWEFSTSDLRSEPDDPAHLSAMFASRTSANSVSRIDIPLTIKGTDLDAKRCLASSGCSKMQRCLAAVRSRRRIPTSFSAATLALSAMSVFSRPTDEAHWIFWSGAREKETFSLLEKTLAKELSPLRDSRSWLTSAHGRHILHVNMRHPDWHTVLKSRPWYDELVLPVFPIPIPANGHNLRKRKAEVPQDSPQDPGDAKPPAKRSRTTRSATPTYITPKLSTQTLDLLSERDSQSSIPSSRLSRPKLSNLTVSNDDLRTYTIPHSPASTIVNAYSCGRERSLSETSGVTLVDQWRTRSSSRLSTDTLLGTPPQKSGKIETVIVVGFEDVDVDIPLKVMTRARTRAAAVAIEPEPSAEIEETNRKHLKKGHLVGKKRGSNGLNSTPQPTVKPRKTRRR